MDDGIQSRGAVAAQKYRAGRAAAGEMVYRRWIPANAYNLVDAAATAVLAEFARAPSVTQTGTAVVEPTAVEVILFERMLIIVDLTEANVTEDLTAMLVSAEFKPSEKNANKYVGVRLPDPLAELLRQFGATVTPHLVRRVRHRDGSFQNEWRPFS